VVNTIFSKRGRDDLQLYTAIDAKFIPEPARNVFIFVSIVHESEAGHQPAKEHLELHPVGIESYTDENKDKLVRKKTKKY
jgi:hypothetical protein